jgi:diaminopimelate epimerase
MQILSETLSVKQTSNKPIADSALVFEKMHGLGNDFVMVLLDDLLTVQSFGDAVKAGKNPIPSLAKGICDRNFGIGADGLIIGFSLAKTSPIDASIFKSLDAGYVIDTTCDIGWIYTNSDGSHSAMCGNGLRCLGLWALRKELVASNRILVSTKAGVQEILVEDESKITVDMGKPVLKTELIPLNAAAAASFVQGELSSPDFDFKVSCVSMGNPHVVIFDAPQAQDCLQANKFSEPLKHLSVQIQEHSIFPEGVNVEWCKTISRNEVHSLIYERGCGATLACASGAAAVVVAGILEGRLERQAKVRLPGGYLSIEWSKSDEHVRMTGPAQTSFCGTISFAALDNLINARGSRSISTEICCS